MRDRLFHILFSISSYSGIILFLLVNRNTDIPILGMPNLPHISGEFPKYIKFFFLFCIFFYFAKLILFIGNLTLPKTSSVMVSKIKPAEGVYLPVYISLFVIALSFNDGFSPQATFLIAFLFVLWEKLERTVYFNPFFLLLWFRAYEVELERVGSEPQLVVLVLTSKNSMTGVSSLEGMVQINDYTYLDY